MTISPSVLTLPIAPTHTNGRWDETSKQVVWDASVAARTNDLDLPISCYANWAEPDGPFQLKHFGRLVLSGDQLTEYCVWRSSLGEKQAAEWDSLLESLYPGEELAKKLNAFRLLDEPTQATSPSAFARDFDNNRFAVLLSSVTATAPFPQNPNQCRARIPRPPRPFPSTKKPRARP